MIKSEHIERASLSKQALSILKARILSGHVVPGTRFIVETLAKELGISRTPIREALSQLVIIGLVIFDGNNYLVVNYSTQDVKELYAIRRVLEIYALREGIPNFSEQKMTKFHLMCERIKNITGGTEEKSRLMIKLDEELHSLIYESSNNTRLKKILFEIKEKILLIHKWGSLVKKKEYYETAPLDEYLELLEYFKSRDVEKAAQLMEKHINDALQFALDCIGV